jgi:hypothetical protein
MKKCWILLVVLVVGTVLVTACGKKKQPRNQAEAMRELSRIKEEDAGNDGGEIVLTAAEKKQAEEKYVELKDKYSGQLTDEEIRNMAENDIKAKKAMAELKAMQDDPEYKAAQAEAREAAKSYMPEDVKENRCHHNMNRIDSWKRSFARSSECKAAADKEKFVQDAVKARLAQRNYECMSGGTYVIGKIGEEARCTKHGTAKQSKPSFD